MKVQILIVLCLWGVCQIMGEEEASCREQSQCYEACVQTFTWCKGVYQKSFPRCDKQLKRCITRCNTKGCPQPKAGTCPNLVVNRCNPAGSSHVINYCTRDGDCDGAMKCCSMVDGRQNTCLNLCVPPV